LTRQRQCPTQILRFDEQNSGDTTKAALGQSLEIRLQENPTSGYRWHVLQAGEPVCKLLSDSFTAGLEAPGQSGVHRWTFQAVAAGTASIRMIYRRAWETGEAARTFMLDLRGGI
jgi:inhibitor of cysteine peptidase